MSLDKRKLLESTVITTDTNSAAALLRYIEHFAVQIVVSAVSTPSVEVKLQGSNDNVNWNDLAGTSNSITATGNILINASNVGYKYTRATFVHTSGSVTAEVIFTGREKQP